MLLAKVLLISTLWGAEQAGHGVNHGVDHGVMGEVFAIDEKNLVEVIMEKLTTLQENGKLDAYNQQIQAKVKNQIERPKPVEGIAHTTSPRTFKHDPSITVTKDLKDHQGVVFHRKGDKLNPLDYKSMNHPFLLIDGDDFDHLTWAFKMLKTFPLAKIILVKGAPLKIMEEIGIKIFFDQFGEITKKLGITQVPALVTQDGATLLVQEMHPDSIYAQDNDQSAPYTLKEASAQPTKATTNLGSHAGDKS